VRRAKEDAVNEAHTVEHGNLRMHEGLGQRPGAGSARDGRRKRAALAATHLLLDVDDGAMRVDALLESARARMAKPMMSRAKLPVSMMVVKEMVTGAATIDGSTYFFTRNILTLPGAAVSTHRPAVRDAAHSAHRPRNDPVSAEERARVQWMPPVAGAHARSFGAYCVPQRSAAAASARSANALKHVFQMCCAACMRLFRLFE